MSVGFLDLVRVTLSTTGTGSTLTIAAAVAGWLDFTGAGGVNGTVYRYAIIDGNNSEIGTATYNSGSNTLAGRTVTKSTNSNAPLNLTSAAILAVSVAAEDLNVGGTNYGTLAAQNANSVGIGTFLTPDSPLTVNANTVAAPGTLPAGTSVLHVVGPDGVAPRYLMDAFGAGMNITARRADGTAASPTALTTNDVILNIAAFGWAGTGPGAWTTSGRSSILMSAAEPWTATAQGAYTTLNTTAAGTTSLLERMRIQPSGGVSINTTTDPGAGNLLLQGSITSYDTGAITTSLPQLTMWNQHAGTDAGSFIVQKSRAASGAGSAVQVGDALGTFAFRGNDSVGTVQNAAFITSLVTGVGSGFVTGNLFFSASTLNFGGPTLQSFASPTTALYTSQVFGNALNTEEITNDNLALGTSINYDSAVYHVFGGSSVTGARCGSLSFLGITAPTSASNTMRDYTGGAWGIIANGTGDNGTNTTPFGGGAGAKGAIIGGNIYSQIFGLSTPASNWLTVAGLEIDCFGTTNVSMAYNWALSLVSINAVRGAALDSALVIYSGAQSFWGPGVGFQNGITFAEVGGNGLVPISSTGTLMGGSVGTLSVIPVANGVDFSLFTFSGSAWKSPNYQVFGQGTPYASIPTMQSAVGGCTFAQGSGVIGSIGGSVSTNSASGNADTRFATGFGCADSTNYPVPYNTSGVLLGNSECTTLFVGNTSAGNGDPTPQGCTLAAMFSRGKLNFSNSAVYGQSGALWLNVYGGWNGSALTFNQTSVTLSTGSATITVPAAPTSHAYVQGMPVAVTGGTGTLATGCVIARVNSPTSLTLSSNPTGNGTATLTFTAGGASPTLATPTFVAQGYQPFSGTPGDTFMINADVRIYDNGFGIAEMFEGTLASYAVSAATNTHAVFVQVGITGASLAVSTGTTHTIGVGMGMTGNSGVEGIAYYAKPGASDWGLFAAASGFKMTVTGSISAPSDPTLKTDIVGLPSMWERFKRIDPVSFRWHERHASFSDPSHVGKKRWGFLSRSHAGLGGVAEALDGGHEHSALSTMHHTLRHDGSHRRQYHTGDTFDVMDHDHLWVMNFRVTREIQARLEAVEDAARLWSETGNLLDRMNGLEARVSVLEEERLAVQ